MKALNRPLVIYDEALFLFRDKFSGNSHQRRKAKRQLKRLHKLFSGGFHSVSSPPDRKWLMLNNTLNKSL